MRWLAAAALLSGAVACHCGGDTTPDGGTAGGATAGGATAGGTAGGAAGGTSGGTAGGGSTAGGLGGGVADAGSTALLPRLIVACRGASGVSSFSVHIWDRANTLTSDVAAPVALAGVGAPAAALAADAVHLFVVHETMAAAEPVVHRYDVPRELADGALPTVTVTAATLGPTASVNKVQLDDIGALWLERSPGEVVRIDDVAAASASSGPSATYRHAFDQIFGFAFEQTNNKLFAGQVSGAGVLVWNHANVVLGDAGVHDFALAADNIATLELAGGRLYGSFFQSDVKVWSGVNTVSMPKAYDFTLDADAGAVSIRDQRVWHGHLVVTVQPTPSTGRVLIYENVGVTFANRAPDVVIDDAALVGAKKAVLGADGTLYVLDLQGVAIFTSALTAPSLAAKLTTDLAVPSDLLLVE